MKISCSEIFYSGVNSKVLFFINDTSESHSTSCVILRNILEDKKNKGSCGGVRKCKEQFEVSFVYKQFLKYYPEYANTVLFCLLKSSSGK
jgi:hypothetical protein